MNPRLKSLLTGPLGFVLFLAVLAVGIAIFDILFDLL